MPETIDNIVTRMDLSFAYRVSRHGGAVHLHVFTQRGTGLLVVIQQDEQGKLTTCVEQPTEPEYPPGQAVHVDTYDEQWGRVATDGEVVEDQGDMVLVNAYSIRANIRVPKRSGIGLR